MNKKIKILVLTLFFIQGILLGSISLKDDRGKEIELKAPPQRIVSLVPSHTEILYTLGLENQVVAVSDYCDTPRKAKSKPTIGGFANASVEKILAMKPDLILSLGTVQIPLVEKLEKKGLPVFWLYPKNVTDVLDSFEKIGQLTGKKTAGQNLRQRIANKINFVTDNLINLKNFQRPSLVRVMGLNPAGTVGNLSFQTDVFQLAGGQNAFSDINKDFTWISGDELKEKNPDVIIICGSDSIKAKEKLKNQDNWKDLTAVKQDRILVMPCNLICRPGPRIAESIETIARYLHPDAFDKSQSHPQRIVSLAPSLTEALFLLGKGECLKGCTTYCNRPEEAKNKEKIGTVIDFNVEKIVTLKPDLVVGMEFAQPRSIEKLKKFGIPVKLFPSPKNFEHLCQSFEKLGCMVGEENRAKKIIHSAKKEVELIKQKLKGTQKIKIFWQLGAKPLFAATNKFFSNDYIKFAGGINITANEPNGIFSREEVLKRNPEVIVIVTMGMTGEEEMRTWQKFKSIDAVKNNHIYIVDSDQYCSPTPQGFAQALKELVKQIHPSVSLNSIEENL